MNAATEPPEHVQVERRMRAQVRESIVEMGVPADRAAEITDLAFHGCDRAMEALLAAVEVSDNNIVIVNALLIAGSLIEVRLKQVRDSVPGLAGDMSARILSGTVRMGGEPS